MKRISAIAIASVSFMLSGCFMAGHGGAITENHGLEGTCGGGCLEYKVDGTGCAKFVAGTASSCGTYFDSLCKTSPKACKNDSKTAMQQ